MKKLLLLCATIKFLSFSTVSCMSMPAPKIASTPKAITTPKMIPTPKATPGKYTISIPIATAIKVENTNPTNSMTLTGVSIKYSTSDEPSKIKTISASGLSTPITPKSTISFRPKLTLQATNQSVSASFIGVSELEINSKKVNLSRLKSRRL